MQLVTNTAMVDRATLASALSKATATLLSARNQQGVWTGELSSSALSTATAVTALAIYDQNIEQNQNAALISLGLNWLAENANGDGGWGDTVRSNSNLSTTLLCWAAFGAVPGARERFAQTIDAATVWLEGNAGGTEPHQISEAILKLYGKDRTFSVPILTMCALAGRLGHVSVAWKSIIPLPFELAALPRSWFGALRLPVVSYALPALIAMGQARHHHAPSRNILRRLVRSMTRKRTLKVLAEVQPKSGGFLEATPLTSFVAMSLASSGQARHVVTRRAIDFIRSSIRQDGSWPIDTDLGTWVTSLSVNALCERVADREEATGALTPVERHSIQRWLLNEQHSQAHAYTGAAPGGWAWTDKSGGVPDADDTAGALIAIRNLEWAPEQRFSDGIAEGLDWLLNLQNSDGGIPTFCRGWGHLPFDRSSPDLTAHAVRAWSGWIMACQPALRKKTATGLQNAIKYLLKTQSDEGTWTPLWFGNQFAPDETNPTYGTCRVVHALSELLDADFELGSAKKIGRAISRAADWIAKAQNENGSWGGFTAGPPSIEETALAIHALAKVLAVQHESIDIAEGDVSLSLRRGVSWLIARVQEDSWIYASPIGFYFARLWYYEKIYPLAFTVGALRAVDAFLVRRSKR